MEKIVHVTQKKLKRRGGGGWREGRFAWKWTHVGKWHAEKICVNMIVPVSCHFKATICRFLVTAHRLSTYLPSLLLRLPSSSSRVSSLRSLDFDLLFSPNHKACDHLHSSTFTHLWFFFFWSDQFLDFFSWFYLFNGFWHRVTFWFSIYVYSLIWVFDFVFGFPGK